MTLSALYLQLRNDLLSNMVGLYQCFTNYGYHYIEANLSNS